MNSNYFEKNKNKILNLYKEQKFLELIKLGDKLIKNNSNDAQLIYLLGLSSINLKKYTDAEKYFEKLLLIKKNPEIYYIHGNIQKKLKKYNNAIVSFESAIKLKSDFSEAYNNLGNTKKIIHQREEAISCYRKAIEFKNNNIEALISLSTILKEDRNYKDLIEVYKSILKLDNNNVKTLYNLGSAYLFTGDISKGRKYFEKIFEIDASFVPSMRNYVSITEINSKNKIFSELEKLDEVSIDNENKILLYNALSKGFFDQNKVDLAFDYLNKSNSLKRNLSNFSMDDQKDQFRKIKLLFDQIGNNVINFSKISTIPIFIVGMPRSGTSLLEQILASHSKIYGAGELNFLQKVIDKIGLDSPSNYKDYFYTVRNYYMNQITKISDKPFIIDKLPLNFKWIGFIRNSLPEAKIIHISRNPMAVCWSNYKTLFTDRGMDFTLSQESIAEYYHLYVDIMNYWKNKYNKNLLNINYDNYVKNFEKDTKSILNFLNLEWEEKIKSFDKTNRVVTTASFQQVRGKIKKDTSKEWKKYSDNLIRMQQALAKFKINF